MTAIGAPAARMPLSRHLAEARTRLIRSAAALLVGCVAGYLLSGTILEFVRAPIEELAASRNASLNFDSVTGAFDLTIAIAVGAGVVLSSPVWLAELFAFIAPGLTRREKRYTIGFLVSAVPLFLAGCAMGLLVFPHMVLLLTSFASDESSSVLDASSYVGFVVKFVAATGIAFVLPVFIVLLNLIGLLPARTIVRSWRLWIIAIVLFSALVTPAADVMSMFLIAVPMSALFVAAGVVAVVHDRLAARRAALDPADSRELVPAL